VHKTKAKEREVHIFNARLWLILTVPKFTYPHPWHRIMISSSMVWLVLECSNGADNNVPSNISSRHASSSSTQNLLPYHIVTVLGAIPTSALLRQVRYPRQSAWQAFEPSWQARLLTTYPCVSAVSFSLPTILAGKK
jgi:hypothetical protein